MDYGASKNFLEAGLNQSSGDSSDDSDKASPTFHYVLLSAICVQKPLLEFQKAKLKLEKEIRESGARWAEEECQARVSCFCCSF